MTTDYAPVPPGMGQCSVTGKIVPEDELVTIQGQRVCAEGKAILLEKLRSGEAMPGEAVKPTVLRRFGCIFLDGLIVGVPLGLLTGAVTGALASNGSANIVLISGVMALLTTAIQVLYFGAMHAARGQTVGKIAGKLKVVNDLDNSPISASTAYTRSLLYAGPGFLSGFAAFTGSQPIIAVAGIVVGVYSLVNTIVALVDSRQRAIHDRVCGTRVIDLS